MRHGRSTPNRASSRKLGILARLGIRGKLNLLLLPPLIAVVLVSVPFVLGQVGTAEAANQSAQVARNAQQLGGLVLHLQRERLVTAAYVANPAMTADTMLQQQKTVDTAVEAVRSSLGPGAPDELAALKAKLERNRISHPLFDTDRFRRHIEAAYVTMWEKHQRGEPPAGFAVAPLSASPAR